MQISYSFDFDKKALLEKMAEFNKFDEFYRPFNRELEEILQPFIDKWLKGSKLQHTVIAPQRTRTLLDKMYRKHIFVPRRDAERRIKKEEEKQAINEAQVKALQDAEVINLEINILNHGNYTHDNINLPVNKIIEYIQEPDFDNRHYENILYNADRDRLLPFRVKISPEDKIGLEVKFTKESLWKLRPLVLKYYVPVDSDYEKS